MDDFDPMRIDSGRPYDSSREAQQGSDIGARIDALGRRIAAMIAEIRCCDRYGTDPDHPKADPTMSLYCTACGIYTSQWYNRPRRGYECCACAARAYHANH